MLNIGPEQDKAWDKARDNARGKTKTKTQTRIKQGTKRHENHKKEPPKDEAALQLPRIVFDLKMSGRVRVRVGV